MFLAGRSRTPYPRVYDSTVWMQRVQYKEVRVACADKLVHSDVTMRTFLLPFCFYSKSCESHIDHVGVGLDGVQKYLSNTLGTTAVDQVG